MSAPYTFYEFFAGGGMARAGLGEGWRCLFANDFDPVKAETYRANWGGDDLIVDDVWAVRTAQITEKADLAWASSPCQDVSLAGNRAGLSGARSSAFWGFWSHIQRLCDQGRPPRSIVIENVIGLLDSQGGADFTMMCEGLAGAGYRFGALEADAAWFTPQSRPRIFVIATHAHTLPGRLNPALHSARVIGAFDRLPDTLKARWIWWDAPSPPARNADLASVLEADDQAPWRPPEKTAALLSLLSPLHQAKLRKMDGAGRAVGAIFRRTRVENGVKVQRAEVRFDGLAGCLRTPGGGSSRQFIVMLDRGEVRTRPLTARECARLMGLPDDYRLPAGSTKALHVIGDGVAVPVVRWLAANILEPLLSTQPAMAAE